MLDPDALGGVSCPYVSPARVPLSSVSHLITMMNAAMYVLLHVGDDRYALASSCVREVVRWRTPTPVPGAPDLLPGIINQRGTIVPIVDLRLLLGLPAQPPSRATRLVIMHHAEVDLALLVDAVADLIDPPSELLPPPPTLAATTTRLLHGVARYAERPLAVFDPDALIRALREGNS